MPKPNMHSARQRGEEQREIGMLIFSLGIDQRNRSAADFLEIQSHICILPWPSRESWSLHCVTSRIIDVRVPKIVPTWRDKKSGRRRE
jgi:hypothetical protein